MLDLNDMERWTKKHDLLLNRIAVINQIHGCQYDHSCGNPCAVSYRLGTYSCIYAGDVLTTWRVYDLPSVDSALVLVDSLSDALWRIRRAGFLRV